MYACVHAYMCTCTCPCAYTYAFTYTYSYSYSYSYSYNYSYSYSYRYTYTYTYTYIDNYMWSRFFSKRDALIHWDVNGILLTAIQHCPGLCHLVVEQQVITWNSKRLSVKICSFGRESMICSECRDLSWCQLCHDDYMWKPHINHAFPWWRNQMETFSTLLTICGGNSSITNEFPAQRPVMRSFDVFFDLRLNKRLSKQSWGWWLETLSPPLWRHCNATHISPVTHRDVKYGTGVTFSAHATPAGAP